MDGRRRGLERGPPNLEIPLGLQLRVQMGGEQETVYRLQGAAAGVLGLDAEGALLLQAPDGTRGRGTAV